MLYITLGNVVFIRNFMKLTDWNILNQSMLGKLYLVDGDKDV